jgi:hypothetical protein
MSHYGKPGRELARRERQQLKRRKKAEKRKTKRENHSVQPAPSDRR